MHEQRTRNPARLLAPAALALVTLAFLIIVIGSTGGGGGGGEGSAGAPSHGGDRTAVAGQGIWRALAQPDSRSYSFAPMENGTALAPGSQDAGHQNDVL